jgi:ribosomal-protein-alanine N-acetyltransferase
MTSAIKESTIYVFKEFKLKRIEAKVYLHNPASSRVLEKNGFEFEGIQKKYMRKNNRFLDCWAFAKVKN